MTTADLGADNGVAHVINTVLIPGDEPATTTTAATTTASEPATNNDTATTEATDNGADGVGGDKDMVSVPWSFLLRPRALSPSEKPDLHDTILQYFNHLT